MSEKKAYRPQQAVKTTLRVNTASEGEEMHRKVQRMINNREPIGEDGAPLIFTQRADGVKPEYNIRTDRFDIAVEAMDAVHGDTLAKRQGKAKETKAQPGPNESNDPGGDGGAD